MKLFLIFLFFVVTCNSENLRSARNIHSKQSSETADDVIHKDDTTADLENPTNEPFEQQHGEILGVVRGKIRKKRCKGQNYIFRVQEGVLNLEHEPSQRNSESPGKAVSFVDIRPTTTPVTPTHGERTQHVDSENHSGVSGSSWTRVVVTGGSTEEVLSSDGRLSSIFSVKMSDGTQRSASAAEFARLLSGESVNIQKTFWVHLGDGSRKRVSEDEFRSRMAQSSVVGEKRMHGNTSGGSTWETFWVIMPNGTQSDVSVEEFNRLRLGGARTGQIRTSYWIQSGDGSRREVTEEEFATFQAGQTSISQRTGSSLDTSSSGRISSGVSKVQVLSNGGSLTEHFYVTSQDGTRKQISVDEYRRLQAEGGGTAQSQKYFIIQSDGREREVTVDEYERLVAAASTSQTQQRFWIQNEGGIRKQVSEADFYRFQGENKEHSQKPTVLPAVNGRQNRPGQGQIGVVGSRGSIMYVLSTRGDLTERFVLMEHDGTQREVSRAEFARLQARGNMRAVVEKLYYVQSRDGATRQVSEEEFNGIQRSGGERTGLGQESGQKYAQERQNSGRKHQEAKGSSRIQDVSSTGSRREQFYVIGQSGVRREITADEYARLQAERGRTISPTSSIEPTDETSRLVLDAEFTRLQAQHGLTPTPPTSEPILSGGDEYKRQVNFEGHPGLGQDTGSLFLESVESEEDESYEYERGRNYRNGRIHTRNVRPRSSSLKSKHSSATYDKQIYGRRGTERNL